MSDEGAFLAAIQAAPGDHLPRLVFADWLDDRGQPGDAAWAELIRAQCRAVASRDRPLELLTLVIAGPEDADEYYRRLDAWAAARADAGRAAADVLTRVAEDVAPFRPPGTRVESQDGEVLRFDPPGPGQGPAGATYFRFDRGLVTSVECPGDVWVAHADALLARHPVADARLRPPPGWDRDADAAWLAGDGRRYAWADVLRVWGGGHRYEREGRTVGALCRLRWPGVEFSC